MEHVEDARARLRGLAVLQERERESALEDHREEDLAGDGTLDRVELDVADAGVRGEEGEVLPVGPADAALRVRLRLGGLPRLAAHAGVGEVPAHDVEETGLDVGVDGLLREAAEGPGVRGDDVAHGLLARDAVADGLVHLLELPVRGVYALARLMKVPVVVRLGDFGDVELLRQDADAFVLASVADERGREETVARAHPEVRAVEVAGLAVAAPDAQPAVRAADVPARAVGEVDADRVALLHALV